MILLVGLGNPGKKYENTPHNIGFQMIDFLAGEKKWKKDKRCRCLKKKIEIESKIVETAKPLTFMNRSGESVACLKKKLGLKTEEIVVVHDDFDLKLGRVKVTVGAGPGGHKGVKSIIKEIGSKDFTRIRIGVKPQGGVRIPLEEFVLQSFSPSQRKEVQKTKKFFKNIVSTLICEGTEKTMSEFNKKKT